MDERWSNAFDAPKGQSLTTTLLRVLAWASLVLGVLAPLLWWPVREMHIDAWLVLAGIVAWGQLLLVARLVDCALYCARRLHAPAPAPGAAGAPTA